MALGLEAGLSSVAWTGAPAGHVLHSALEFLMAQAEPGVCCPMTMTYARRRRSGISPDLAPYGSRRSLASRYDPSSQPSREKAGVTIGMAMTEKQGGSDVRANTHARQPRRGRPWRAIRLVGHKWFCSAPMCDAFLTLAYTDQGLTCFLAPRWTPDGERNAIH